MILKWMLARLFGNLGRVDNLVWRSGQSWLLFSILPFLGLKAVLNLSHKPKRDLQDRFEEWLSRALGIEYVTFPTIGPEDGFKEAYNQLLTFVGEKKRVLVHCEGGQDRTGGVVSYYMRDHMGASLTQIVASWKIYHTPSEPWLEFLFKAFAI